MAWNGSDKSSAQSSAQSTTRQIGQPANHHLLHGLIAGLVIVALGSAALWFFTRPTPPAPRAAQPTKPGKITAAQPATIQPPAAQPPATDRSPASPTKDAAAKKSPVQASTAERQPASPVETNAAKRAKSKRLFESAADELIVMATTAPAGSQMPPLPGMSDGDTDDFIKSYRKPLEILPTDTAEIKQIKEHVNDMRDQIAGLIAQNPDKSLSQILNEHRDQFNANSRMSSEAQTAYDKMIEAGDTEMAEKYRQKANELLRQTGAEEIQPNDKDEENGENEQDE